MSRARKTKDSFKRDDHGRAILGSAKEMAEWVKLGFEEQEKRKTLDAPFTQNYIDFSNCVLYISYPIGSKEHSSEIFNLCDMAGVVPGIEKIEGNPNYLYEVTRDIHLDGSLLYGNFFHYVKFDGMVEMDKVTVRSNFSCFKCLFLNFVYMQHIEIKGSADFEQCDFRRGIMLTETQSRIFRFNNCFINERLSLSSVNLDNLKQKEYFQNIEITNSTVENLKLSKVKTNGLPIYIGDSSIRGLRIDNVALESSLTFHSCILDGVVTAVNDDEGQRNKIKGLTFHSCELDAQCHIENTDVEKLEFNFSKIADNGRLRLSQCRIEELIAGCSSVFGQMDLQGDTITTVCMEGTCVQGYINSQDNHIEKYTDRHTLRLLKNEALKVNDHVEATRLYAKEMNLLLKDKDIPVGDKVSLWISKCFSKFGESWSRALWVTLMLSVILTFVMLVFGSSKFGFDLSGEFMGVGCFVTALLDSINVFSIPLFSDTIKEYGLNVFGQILYFVIKVVVAYGTYQFVTAFRKYGRS